MARSIPPSDPGLGGLVGLNGDKERSRSVLLATWSIGVRARGTERIATGTGAGAGTGTARVGVWAGLRVKAREARVRARASGGGGWRSAPA